MTEKLITAGMEILEEEGVLSRVTLRKVAARAGCAHTNAYNYFKSLGALHWAMVGEALEQLSDSCRPEAGTSAAGIIGTYLDFALDHPALYRLIWTEALDPDSTPADSSFLSAVPLQFMEAFSELYPAADADRLRAAVSTAHALVHGRILFVLSGRLEMPDRGEWCAGVVAEALELLDYPMPGRKGK